MERRSLGVGYKLLRCRGTSSGLLKAGSNLPSSPCTKSQPNYIRFSLQLVDVESKSGENAILSEKSEQKSLSIPLFNLKLCLAVSVMSHI
jgi:hypothetical protein